VIGLKKQVPKIDSQGYYVAPDFAEKIDGVYKMPDDCVEIPFPDGMFKPKWDGTQWVEGLTQTEVDQRRTEIQQQQEDGEAKAYLNETDWYVARYVETSKAVPDDVKTKREEMRNVLSP
jgi:hypothetical protein